MLARARAVMPSGPLLTVIKLAIAGLLFWAIFSAVDLSQVVDRFDQISLLGLLAVLLLLLLQTLTASVRWTRFARLEFASFGLATAWHAWVVGLFFSQGLISTFGQDAYRIWRMSLLGSGVSPAARVVVLDRMAGLLCLLLLTGISLPFLHAVAPEAARGLFFVALALGLLFVGGLVVASRRSVLAVLRRWRFFAWLISFERPVRALARDPVELAAIVGWGLLTHALSVAVAAVIAWDLGSTITPLQCLLVVPPALLISLLPFSIAGWGLREGAMVAGFQLLSQGSADPLIISLLLGFGALAVGALGGLLWLLDRRRMPTASDTEAA